jgi:hypothetical protein
LKEIDYDRREGFSFWTIIWKVRFGLHSFHCKKNKPPYLSGCTGQGSWVGTIEEEERESERERMIMIMMIIIK